MFDKVDILLENMEFAIDNIQYLEGSDSYKFRRAFLSGSFNMYRWMVELKYIEENDELNEMFHKISSIDLEK